MKRTKPLSCKYCGEPDDLRCSCTKEIPRLTDLPIQVASLMPALQAGYYVIDGREASTPKRRTHA